MENLIKFRGWSEGVSRMTYFDNPIISNSELKDGETWGIFIPAKDGTVYLTGYQSMMQFTGLRDCKRTEEYPEGQEIYSGDIVKATNKNGWARKFEIMWINDRTRLMAWNNSQPNISFNLTCNKVIELQVEVIGNIYEQPALQEK